jgi:hypothetical protein
MTTLHKSVCKKESHLLNLLAIRNPKPGEQHLTTTTPHKRNLFTTTYAHVFTQKCTQENQVAEARGVGGEKGPRGNTVFMGRTTF